MAKVKVATGLVKGWVFDMAGSQADEVKRWPTPTVEEPIFEALADMCMGATDSTATDGCGGLEADGECEHGYPAWPLYKGMI